MGIVLVGNPDTPRVNGFLAAADRVRTSVRLVPWARVIAGDKLDPAPDEIVRLETPEMGVHRELVALGHGDMAGDTGERIEPRAALELPDRLCGLHYARQRFCGFRAVLRRLSQEPVRRWLTAPDDVATVCDKGACHPIVAASCVPVPAMLQARSREELRDAMARQRVRRAMVKLRVGASAIGIAALRLDARGRARVFTTMARDRHGFYSTRQVRDVRQDEEIDAILAWLFAEGAHVEVWHDKARLDRREYDVRVLVIAGGARHVVGRCASAGQPFTNLHLGSDRVAADVIRAHLGTARWDALIHHCEAAARCFGGLHSVGVDAMWTEDAGPMVIELNAFGDLLHGVTWQGWDPWEAQLRLL